MYIALVVIAFILLLVGLIGSIVPALPGPPLSYAGLLLLQWSGYGGFSITFLVVWGAISVVVTISDYILPAWLTKKFGGSKMAVTGSILGLLAGIFFFPPIGLLVGPFVGALIGELLHNQTQAKRRLENSGEPLTSDANVAAYSDAAGNVNALVAAFGAFFAFILGTGAKLITGSMMIFYAVKAVF